MGSRKTGEWVRKHETGIFTEKWVLTSGNYSAVVTEDFGQIWDWSVQKDGIEIDEGTSGTCGRAMKACREVIASLTK